MNLILAVLPRNKNLWALIALLALAAVACHTNPDAKSFQGCLAQRIDELRGIAPTMLFETSAPIRAWQHTSHGIGSVVTFPRSRDQPEMMFVGVFGTWSRLK